MSNTPQDEIKARLEVAQLYEEMGQNAKAARYYLAAAEIALKGKFFDQGKGFLEKVLVLDPEEKQARNYLDRLNAHLASQGGPGGGAAAPAREENRPSSGGAGGVTIPTPSVYLRKDQITAILAQVASAPNPKFFPFNPLPKVDVKAIEAKARATEAKREEQRMRERTSVESAFGSGGSSFGGGGSLFNQAQRSGRGRDKERDKDKPEEGGDDDRRRSRRGGANQDLANSILKRLQDR
jgi:hypothetical protein